MSVTFQANGGRQSLNLANGNARMLLGALGLPNQSDDDMCGEISHEELDALVTFCPTRSRETTVEKGNGPTMIHCGCPPEQFERYLGNLRIVLHEAKTLNAPIYWG
jgi:hypothetical protein